MQLEGLGKVFVVSTGDHLYTADIYGLEDRSDREVYCRFHRDGEILSPLVFIKGDCPPSGADRDFLTIDVMNKFADLMEEDKLPKDQAAYRIVTSRLGEC